MKSRAMAVVIAAGLVRLVIAATTPLFPDETYYWEWSRRLATGYFDHPPLIAWLIWVGTSLFGATSFGVRVVPVLAGVVASAIVTATARRLAGDRGALITAIVLAAMPISAAGLVLATPDAGLLAAAAAVLYAVVRALELPPASRASLNWWSVAGVAQGIAFWSKYTAILIPVGIALAFAVHAELRARLREPGPYVASLIASSIFAPVLLWNSQHDWISFTFQIAHGLAGSGGSVLRREGEFLAAQLGLVSPILFVLMLVAVVQGARGSTANAMTKALGMLALFVLAFFTASATQRRVEANWPGLAYLPATLLLVAHPRTPRWDRWLTGGIGVAIAITLITYLNAFVPILSLPASRDPTARAAGWDDIARAVGATRDSLAESQVAGHRSRVFIAANRYQEASQLAYHLPDHPRTLALNADSRPNQYDLWPTFDKLAAAGDHIVFVAEDVPGTHSAVVALTPHFASAARGVHVELKRNGTAVGNLRVWVLRDWRGTWPPTPIRSRP